MKLLEAYDSFMLYKQSYCSDTTVIDYAQTLNIFFKWLDKKDIDVSELTDDLIMRYCAFVTQNARSPATAITYKRDFKCFLKYIESELNQNLPCKISRIKVRKPPRREVKPLSDNDVKALFEAASSPIAWIQARNKAIISFGLDSGLREKEIVSIKLSRLDKDNRTIHVIGKGSKERTIPIGQFTLQLLLDYICKCPYHIEDNVFLSQHGQPLTENAVKVFMNRLKHKTKLDICCHKLRHNFTTESLIRSYNTKGVMNTEVLQYMLGHNDIRTTQQYVHIAFEQIIAKNFDSRLDSVYAVKKISN